MIWKTGGWSWASRHFSIGRQRCHWPTRAIDLPSSLSCHVAALELYEYDMLDDLSSSERKGDNLFMSENAEKQSRSGPVMAYVLQETAARWSSYMHNLLVTESFEGKLGVMTVRWQMKNQERKTRYCFVCASSMQHTAARLRTVSA
jgi:hypothetical protein